MVIDQDERSENNLTKTYAKLRVSHRPHYPLNHFERRFVVDLQAQIFKSDGQMPPVYPPQFFGLEFTGKFGWL
ncbi:hypothetical protein [Bradyrhizobium sp. BR 1432]|uniref:hypothetical protein n=1 Tax=Bradyrhizobium sp. BR 1432 TaxID=3447966 RepID=UPI003EE597F7